MHDNHFKTFLGILYALSSCNMQCQASMIVKITRPNLIVCPLKKVDIVNVCLLGYPWSIQRIRGGSDEFQDDNAANAEDQYSGLQSEKDEEVNLGSFLDAFDVLIHSDKKRRRRPTAKTTAPAPATRGSGRGG